MQCPNCGQMFEPGTGSSECPYCHTQVYPQNTQQIPAWQPFNAAPPPLIPVPNDDAEIVKLLRKIERHTSTAAGVLVTLLVFYCLAAFYVLTVIFR